MAPSAKAVAQAVKQIDQYAISQYIYNITITPEPNAVVFDFSTNLPTLPVVEIFRHVQTNDGKLLFAPEDAITFVFDFLDGLTGNRFMKHHARVTGLDQDTSFNYRITATDGPRKVAVAIGWFTTGRRSADVVVRDIQIWNDGDPGLDASGELSFLFAIYDADDDRMNQRSFARSISSGEVVDLPFGTGAAFNIPAAPDFMSVYVLGREDDSGILSNFDQPDVPQVLPAQATHSEGDDWVLADAFQQLQLPNASGEYRLGFSLNSGPWGIMYVITGWMNVHVTTPPPTFENGLTKVSDHARTVSMGRVGARAGLRMPDGDAHIFGFGPDGVIAEPLPNAGGRSKREWALTPTGGADSATIIAHDEYSADIVTVTEGTVRITRRAVGRATPEPAQWKIIGRKMQPLVTALSLADGNTLLAGLADTGEVRVTTLRERHSPKASWAALSGRFVGCVAALETESGVELFAVTAAGEVRYTLWGTGAKRKNAWHSLGGEGVLFVCAVADEAGQHLVVLTRERQFLGMSRQQKGWPKRWQVVGTLDDMATRPKEKEDVAVYSPA